jgi:hypothetical protein
MDTVLSTYSLDVLPAAEKSSLNLTTTVNNILNGSMNHVTREHVLGFCKILLLGDDLTSTSPYKSLPYIAREITSDPPGYKVVVTVVKVSNNLQEILLERVRMFKQLTYINDPCTMVSACTRMIIYDPRKYNPGELNMLLEKPELTRFTYKRKNEDTLEKNDVSQKRPKVGNDNVADDQETVLQEAVEALMEFNSSPVRASIHAKLENVPTGSSVMSETSEVEKMTPNGHRASARILEVFFSSS